MRRLALVAFAAAAVLKAGVARADEGQSNQPYIDQLRAELQKRDGQATPADSPEGEATGASPYIDSLKAKLPPEKREGSYIEQLKAEDPERFEAPKADGEGYTAKLKKTLPEKGDGGAIEAVKEGHSDLKMKIEGPIHSAMGLRYTLSPLARSFVAATGYSTIESFNTIYGSNYAPDFALYYEYQIFHSEWFGSLGVYGNAEMTYFSGAGRFAFALTNPTTGGLFSTTSSVGMSLFFVPVTVGLDYRFNLFRILRPFIMAGPTAIGIAETRNDSVAGNRVIGAGVNIVGGVSLLLDWLSKSSAWGLYSNYGVKHSYLTVDATYLQSLVGPVSANALGLSAGLAFEF